MATTVLIHLTGEEAILCDAEQLPEPSDSTITVTNVRKRDGKDVNFLEPNVKSVIFPMTRINFIEILQGEESDEKILSFVRE